MSDLMIFKMSGYFGLINNLIIAYLILYTFIVVGIRVQLIQNELENNKKSKKIIRILKFWIINKRCY